MNWKSIINKIEHTAQSKDSLAEKYDRGEIKIDQVEKLEKYDWILFKDGSIYGDTAFCPGPEHVTMITVFDIEKVVEFLEIKL